MENILDLVNKKVESMTSNIYKTLKEEFESAGNEGIKKGVEVQS